MSIPTEDIALLEEFSDIIRTKELELKFREAQKIFSALEKDPDNSSEKLQYTYFIAGYNLGIEKLHLLIDDEIHFLDRMIDNEVEQSEKSQT